MSKLQKNNKKLRKKIRKRKRKRMKTRHLRQNSPKIKMSKKKKSKICDV